MRLALIIAASAVLIACTSRDDNDAPRYGKLGLPENCRAYVQVAVDGYRAKKYTAEETMNGLERNCGAYGGSWKSNRDR